MVWLPCEEEPGGGGEGGRDTSQHTIEIIWVSDDGGLDQEGGRARDEKCLAPKYILGVESTGRADGCGV